VLAIVGDNSEEFNENNNPVLNPANIDRGANHLAEGETAESLATREKIRLSADKWRIIREAVENGTSVPSNSSKDMLLGYHYALRQQAKQLAKEKVEIQRRKDSAIAASNVARRARSDVSHTNARRNYRHGSRYENLEYSERQSISKNLDLSFLSVDEQGNIVPKTPEAALVAAQAYLLTTRPSPGDPREHMHRAALNELNMVGHKLSAKGEEAHHHKEAHKPRSPRRHNSPRHRSSDLDSHHQNNMEEPEDPDLQTKNVTMKMTKKRWGHRALPAGFAPHQYPRDSNYLTINKSMTDHRNHSHGSQTIYKQYKYWEEPKKQQCKVYSYTSPAQQGHG
jgi:hypothetical protein